MSSIRLNKLLSQAGIASRRLADELILQGRVEINGVVISEPGTRAEPGDDIRVDGRRVRTETERRYILMYKPRGVLSTRSDPHQRRTVIDLLAASGVRGYFYPVGRLDYDSEGLMLLTNDGEFAQRVMHPRYELERTYEALVEGVPDERDLQRLRRGIIIDGRRTLPATARLLRVTESREGPRATLELTLREGRNRQVRHMCSAIAHPVVRLARTRIGGLADRRMRPGQIRDLTPAELKALAGPDRSGHRVPSRSSIAAPQPGQGSDGRPRRSDRSANASGRGRVGRPRAPGRRRR